MAGNESIAVFTKSDAERIARAVRRVEKTPIDLRTERRPRGGGGAAASAGGYIALSAGWYLDATSGTPPAWQTLLRVPSTLIVDVDCPVAGTVVGMQVLFRELNLATGTWSLRIYNATTASAVNAPVIAGLADGTTDSTMGGALVVSAHDKLQMQILDATAADAFTASINTDIFILPS